METSVNDRPLALSLWYPAEQKGPSRTVGGNAVFVGNQASADVPIAGALLPLVLLNHGGLRSAPDSGSWLAARLAQAGFVVAEINGPRSGSVDEVWQRPDDVRRVLDYLSDAPEWSDLVNKDQVAVVGFALGGTAALALAGAQFDVPSLVSACTGEMRSPDCGWFAAQGVSLSDVDSSELAKDHTDMRIAAAIAINPEYVDVLTTVRLEGWAADVLTMSLGVREVRLQVPADNRVIEAHLENAKSYDAFSICTADAETFLGDAAILCTSSTPDAREAVHAQIAEGISGYLKLLYE